jgi:glutathione S-transferase
MALARSGHQVALREVLLSDKPAEMLEASSKGTVPVMILADGTVLDESRDIMRWALTRRDPDHWLDVDQDLAETLIDINDQDFKEWLDRYKYAEYFPDQTAAEYRAQGQRFLSQVEERLAGQAYLFGERPSYADIAIGPFIRQFAHVDMTWFEASPYRKLIDWLERFENSQVFINVMEKYSLWKPGDPAMLFPAA